MVHLADNARRSWGAYIGTCSRRSLCWEYSTEPGMRHAVSQIVEYNKRGVQETIHRAINTLQWALAGAGIHANARNWTRHSRTSWYQNAKRESRASSGHNCIRDSDIEHAHVLLCLCWRPTISSSEKSTRRYPMLPASRCIPWRCSSAEARQSLLRCRWTGSWAWIWSPDWQRGLYWQNTINAKSKKSAIVVSTGKRTFLKMTARVLKWLQLCVAWNLVFVHVLLLQWNSRKNIMCR